MNTTRPVIIAGWAAVAALLAFSLMFRNGIALDLMFVIMTVVGALFGNDVLPFALDWAGMALRVAALIAAVVLALIMLRRTRAAAGRCPRCGRGPHPMRPLATFGADRLARFSRVAALVSIPPAVGYAALKVHWAFGGTIGLADPTVFEGIRPWSPGFTDTAVMAAIGIAVAVWMAWSRNPRGLKRWIPLLPAVVGCLMLLPVAVLGTIANIIFVAGGGPETQLAAWVGWFVYTCFAAWGGALTVVTAEYYYRTRPGCRECGRAGYVRIAA